MQRRCQKQKSTWDCSVKVWCSRGGAAGEAAKHLRFETEQTRRGWADWTRAEISGRV